MPKGNLPKSQYLNPDMMVITGWATIFVLIVLGFYLVIDVTEKKSKATRSHLLAITRVANIYNKEHDIFPESFEELEAFADEHYFEEEMRIPRKDPWKQEYSYFKISDERAAVVTGGRNRRIDTDFDTLSTSSQEKVYKFPDEDIYIFNNQNDDCVYLAGSWPSGTP